MFKFKKKHIIPAVTTTILIFLICLFIPVTRKTAIDILKFPLVIFNAIKREVSGLIFYHHNYVENERLNREVGLLRSRLNEARECFLENERIHKLLSFKQDSPNRLVVARVIARDPSNWACTVIVNKGLNAGIKKGMVVINALGLVGRVVEAGSLTSKIMLINDSNMGVSAVIQRSRQEGLVSGSLGGSLVMKYLSKDSDVAVSDIVVSSGITGIYPKGVLIGSVTSVGFEFSGLSKYAIIKPAVDLNALEEVLIILQ